MPHDSLMWKKKKMPSKKGSVKKETFSNDHIIAALHYKICYTVSMFGRHQDIRLSVIGWIVQLPLPCRRSSSWWNSRRVFLWPTLIRVIPSSWHFVYNTRSRSTPIWLVASSNTVIPKTKFEYTNVFVTTEKKNPISIKKIILQGWLRRYRSNYYNSKMGTYLHLCNCKQ